MLNDDNMQPFNQPDLPTRSHESSSITL